MALPTLTPEQRAQALEKAAAVRKMRAELKHDISKGDVKISDLVNGEFGAYSDQSEAVNKTKLSDLLGAVPGIGRVKVGEIMDGCAITPSRRLGGLGQDQRRRLIAKLEDEGKA